MCMTTETGSSEIVQLFSYDASGKVVAVDYSKGGNNFTTYYYLRNAQGDIVKLIDGSGTTVVEYLYDTWGKLLAITGTLKDTVGTNQPFRYRGYVYDNETGWYYLKSRYYNPEIGRFISADVYLSTGQGVIGHNAYAYCLNNPVNMTDSNGEFGIFTALGAVVGGLVNGIIAAATGEDIIRGVVEGAVSGAITGAVCDIITNPVAALGATVGAIALVAAGGFVAGFVSSVVGEQVSYVERLITGDWDSYEPTSFGTHVKNGVIGSITNMVSFAFDGGSAGIRETGKALNSLTKKVIANCLTKHTAKKLVGTFAENVAYEFVYSGSVLLLTKNWQRFKAHVGVK